MVVKLDRALPGRMARWRTGGGVYVSSLRQRGLVGVTEPTDSVTLEEPVTSLRGSRQSIGLSAARQTPKVQSSCRVSRRFQNVKHVQVRKDLHLVTLYSYFPALMRGAVTHDMRTASAAQESSRNTQYCGALITEGYPTLFTTLRAWPSAPPPRPCWRQRASAERPCTLRATRPLVRGRAPQSLAAAAAGPRT